MTIRRVALLAVGSFNPPTIAHLRMLEVAKSYLESRDTQVLEGIMSPVADSYNHKKTLASAEHRFAMVCESLKSSTWIRGDNWECTRSTWTRSLQVLQHHNAEIKSKFGDDVRLMLVVGGDVVDSFTRILPDGSSLWNSADIRSIVSDFGLIVITREASIPFETLKSMDTLQDVAEKIVIIQDEVCPCSVSSTRLRSAISQNKSIKYSTPDDVIEYIKKHGLYR